MVVVDLSSFLYFSPVAVEREMVGKERDALREMYWGWTGEED